MASTSCTSFLQKSFLTIFLTGALLSVSVNVQAQVSLVPVHHPVYDWLYHQRVAGHLPNFNYESLPLSRNEIAKLLHRVKSVASLSSNQAETLESYLTEFHTEKLIPKGDHTSWFHSNDSSFIYVNDSIFPWESKAEKHLLTITDPNYFAVLDAGLGYRFIQVDEGDNRYRSALNLLNQIRFFAGTKRNLGLHIEYRMASPIGAAEDPFYYDGYYSYNWISIINKNGGEQGETLSHLEGYGTVSPFSGLKFSLGNGNLKSGAGSMNSQLFSRNSIPLNWFKLDLGKKLIRFSMTHATLTWPSSIKYNRNNNLLTKNSPQRFVRLNDLRIQPFSWFEFHIYEMVNYSNRGMEVAYLNPFNSLALAERNLQDQDNGWAGASIIARPIKGIEFYAEIIADDVRSASDIFSKKTYPETSRFARRYGVQYVPLSNLRLFTEYNRIDPFTYSHPYDLNAHTDKGIALGSQLPPNSDQLMLGARLLGNMRSWIDIRFSRIRNGQSIYDNSGNLTFNAGENVNTGRNKGEDASWLFLDGDPHRWLTLRIDASWEIRRALTLSGRFEKRWMQLGTQLNDQQIFWVDVNIGI